MSTLRGLPDIYTDEVIWAFASSEDSESWQGPYATQQDATDAAVDEECSYVCEARWISPGKVAAQAIDVDDLTERMDETEFVCGTFDEAIFEVPAEQREEAKAALAQALSAWAERFFPDKTSRFMCVGSPIHDEGPGAYP